MDPNEALSGSHRPSQEYSMIEETDPTLSQLQDENDEDTAIVEEMVPQESKVELQEPSDNLSESQESTQKLTKLQETFTKLVTHFPQRVIHHNSKSNEKLRSELKALTVDIVQDIIAGGFELPRVSPDDDAPLSSEYELLSLVFFECLRLLKPPFEDDRFQTTEVFFSHLDPILLFQLLSSVKSRDPREARFIENIIICLNFEKTKDLKKQYPTLLNLVNKQNEIAVIENFKFHNQITVIAYDFLSSLFATPHAQTLLQNAYGMLDITETELKANPNPLLPGPKNVASHLEDLLPQNIVQFGTGGDMYGRTFSATDIAISNICFTELEDKDEDPYSRKQRTALLVILLLHEMAHLKKITYYSVKKFKKSTPECDDCAENIIDGGSLKGLLPILPETTAAQILNLDSWKSPKFVDQIVQLPTGSLSKEYLLHRNIPCLYFHDTWDPSRKIRSNDEIQEMIQRCTENQQ